jgi:hypothetical protein
MTRINDMTDDQLYAEINAWPSDPGQCAEPDAPSETTTYEAPAAVAFNSSFYLSLTNPERLLGLTPAQCIALVEANGACQGVRHALQIAANRSGGGWGEILRSPHCADWLQWFVYNVDGVMSELQALAKTIQLSRMMFDQLEDAAMGKLMGERNYQMETISAAKYEAIHEAQRELLDHWSEQHRMLPVEMYQELSRLSNKLALATMGVATEREIETLLLMDEKPAIQTYLRRMRRARENERASQELADKRYSMDKATLRAQLDARSFELQEALAQYLITCTVEVKPLDSTPADA